LETFVPVRAEIRKDTPELVASLVRQQTGCRPLRDWIARHPNQWRQLKESCTRLVACNRNILKKIWFGDWSKFKPKVDHFYDDGVLFLYKNVVEDDEKTRTTGDEFECFVFPGDAAVKSYGICVWDWGNGTKIIYAAEQDGFYGQHQLELKTVPDKSKYPTYRLFRFYIHCVLADCGTMVIGKWRQIKSEGVKSCRIMHVAIWKTELIRNFLETKDPNFETKISNGIQKIREALNTL